MRPYTAAEVSQEVEEVVVIPPVCAGADSYVLLKFYEMSHGLVQSLLAGTYNRYEYDRLIFQVQRKNKTPK
jgi:hypothetical protein